MKDRLQRVLARDASTSCAFHEADIWRHCEAKVLQDVESGKLSPCH